MAIYTIRNLVSDAYRESGIVGIGMTMTAEQQSEGVSKLNFILDSVYAQNAPLTTIVFPVTFTGLDAYTIGAVPPTSGEIQPDIAVDVVPIDISQITITVGNSRLTTYPITADSYINRSLDTITNNAPRSFWYERTQPLSNIKFLYGNPSGPGEIIYKAALVDVNPNTNFSAFPRSLRPFLVYELAAKLANSNGFDATPLQIQSNSYWNIYKNSAYEGQSYTIDYSVPGLRDNNSRNNILTGWNT